MDITGKKTIEEFLMRVLDTLPDAVFLMNRDVKSGSERVKRYLVRYNGFGMPSSELDFIFTPLYKK
ncbi:MAG: hypothetical protein JXA49_06705 [Actinobacteria bacterium]|nr:hypothetical protein [Actinomycetota bacterium]